MNDIFPVFSLMPRLHRDQSLTILGHLRTRGAGQHTRVAQDSRCNLTEPAAHEQFDQLCDLQLVV